MSQIKGNVDTDADFIYIYCLMLVQVGFTEEAMPLLKRIGKTDGHSSLE